MPPPDAISSRSRSTSSGSAGSYASGARFLPSGEREDPESDGDTVVAEHVKLGLPTAVVVVDLRHALVRHLLGRRAGAGESGGSLPSLSPGIGFSLGR